MADVPPRRADLAALVDEWLDWHAAAELLGVTPVAGPHHDPRARARRRRPAPGAGQRVPAEFIQDGLVVKGLPGLLTLLHDDRYDDRECIAWLFLDDDRAIRNRASK